MSEREAIDRNFAVHLPVIDRVFGTAYKPGHWPRSYGIDADPFPDGWFAQLAHPFRSSGVEPPGTRKSAP